jgi:predicted transcriptional regulator
VIPPNISLIIFIFFSNLFEINIMSTETTAETINERVNSIIEKEGHTIATFAKKIGVPWTTIKNIVSGRNAPSYDIIVKIINAVDWVDANYLVMGEELTKGNQGNLLTIVERQNKTIESQQKTIDRLTKKMLEN